jgi:hypothetical protein
MRSGLRTPMLTMLLTLGLIGGGGAALAAVGAMTTPADDLTGCAAPTDSPSPEPTESATASPTDGVDAVATDDPVVTDDPAVTEDGDAQGEDQNCDGEATDDNQDGDAQGEDPGDQGDETDDPQGATGEDQTPPADTTDPQREAECNGGAGVDGSNTAAGEDPVATTGLDHAIEQVLANCLKNPDAPGLPNALQHLVANAERKAAHDAEKAAGEHGNSGTHGHSADAPGHSGEAHGNSGEAPGHSGEHGNPHD